MENNEEIKEEYLDNGVPNQKTEKKKSKLWIILLIVLLCVIGIIVYAKVSEDNCSDVSYYTPSGSNPSLLIDAKPIIYIYPERQVELTVKLGKPENITCSYPKYENEWKVIANPNGTLVDTKTGRSLYALYWEGIYNTEKDITEGFVVKGEDTITFLEEKLEILGLNEREAEEFIVYWLPKLEANKYNYIRFATMEEINEAMPLELSSKPDTVIRVLMQFKGLDEYIEVPEQKLGTPTRDGFVVVEWGGTELK